MFKFETERIIETPVRVVWEVVSDVVGYADAAPGLSRAEIVAGSGEGMQRRCYDASGRGWSETCTLWDEEGHRYAFEVDTATYPFPLNPLIKRFEGTWSVEPAAGATRIIMRFVAEPRYGVLGQTALWLLGRRFKRETEGIFDNWEKTIRVRLQIHAHEAK